MSILILRSGGAVEDPGGGEELVHGQSAIITGSGFGTKAASTPTIWDTCEGTSVGTLWTGSNAISYATPASVSGEALPHARGSKYLTGNHNNSGSPGVWVYTSYTAPAAEFWTVAGYWMRVDSGFDANDPALGPQDDQNFKEWSIGSPSTYGSDPYYYFEINNSTWNTAAPTITWHNEGNGSSEVVSGFPNFVTQWTYHERAIKISNTDGQGTFRIVSSTLHKEGDMWRFSSDSRPGSSSTFEEMVVGGYCRYHNGSGSYPNNRRYYKDIYYDRQATNPGRFVLTNHATYTSSTLLAHQPYTAWSSTSVTLTVYGGALSAGTVHLHYRDEVNGHQYLGPRTLQ